MLKHIVMWKFADNAEGKTKNENMEIIKESLYSLVPIIPQLKKMEIGTDVTHSEMSFDMILCTEFDSKAELSIYMVHPEHIKVSEYVSKVRLQRAVIDYYT